TNQVRVLLHGFGERAEDDAEIFQLFLKGGGYRDAVEDGIDGDARQHFLLAQRDAELFVGLEQLGIDLLEAFWAIFLGFGGRVVNNVLVIDWRVMYIGPGGFAHGLPVAVGLETPIEEPFRLMLLGGNQADDVLIEAAGDGIGFDLSDETPFI